MAGGNSVFASLHAGVDVGFEAVGGTEGDTVVSDVANVIDGDTVGSGLVGDTDRETVGSDVVGDTDGVAEGDDGRS